MYNKTIIYPSRSGYSLGGMINRPIFSTLPYRPINRIVPFISEPQQKPIIKTFQK